MKISALSRDAQERTGFVVLFPVLIKLYMFGFLMFGSLIVAGSINPGSYILANSIPQFVNIRKTDA